MTHTGLSSCPARLPHLSCLLQLYLSVSEPGYTNTVRVNLPIRCNFANVSKFSRSDLVVEFDFLVKITKLVLHYPSPHVNLTRAADIDFKGVLRIQVVEKIVIHAAVGDFGFVKH